MEQLKNFLKDCLKNEQLGFLNLTPDMLNNSIEKFLLYLQELKKWNRAYNLTAIENEKEIIVKHFMDSLLYLCYIPDEKLCIADVGSGAGFPGVPIAIVREKLKITLIEPSWKRSAFLKNIKKKLKLNNIFVYQSKAEEIEEKFDIVIIRAVWSTKDFVENCEHLLKKNGFFIISKGLKLQDELKNLPRNFKAEFTEFSLPISNEMPKRFIIKIERCEYSV
ncbi:16S rRNA (guanine(527)-N(7))-methyltransferase RsmG [Thermodesulfovibrio hydrogeniphilus]